MMSESGKNIEIFDTIVALILTKLHGTFPVPSNICARDIYSEVAKLCLDADVNKDIYLCYIPSTFLFLCKEKFIEYHPISVNEPANGDSVYCSAVLTLKGLTILRAVPKSVSNEPPEDYFNLLKDALKGGAKSSITEAVKLLFTAALSSISLIQ